MERENKDDGRATKLEKKSSLKGEPADCSRQPEGSQTVKDRRPEEDHPRLKKVKCIPVSPSLEWYTENCENLPEARRWSNFQKFVEGMWPNGDVPGFWFERFRLSGMSQKVTQPQLELIEGIDSPRDQQPRHRPSPHP